MTSSIPAFAGMTLRGAGMTEGCPAAQQQHGQGQADVQELARPHRTGAQLGSKGGKRQHHADTGAQRQPVLRRAATAAMASADAKAHTEPRELEPGHHPQQHAEHGSDHGKNPGVATSARRCAGLAPPAPAPTAASQPRRRAARQTDAAAARAATRKTAACPAPLHCPAAGSPVAAPATRGPGQHHPEGSECQQPVEASLPVHALNWPWPIRARAGGARRGPWQAPPATLPRRPAPQSGPGQHRPEPGWVASAP